MERIAFTMKLLPGFEAEYQLRHQAIWPDLATLLHSKGIRDYSIFLDEMTLTLFACMRIENSTVLKQLPQDPLMQQWWAYMRDIMETHPDNSPVTVGLKEVFYQP
jgi:L-rhamnose mutarotase